MILGLNCRNMSRRAIFPLAISLTYCFSVTIFPKQTLRTVRISPLRRSGHLIEIMDFVARLSVSFSSQIKLHLRSIDRAAGSRGERASLPPQRYRATLKRPPPLQPKRQSFRLQ